ncbi:MAG TPA: endonuclease/exonuclease/phosphatase family protein [Anaerohalosphaeraceae bacterium]|nr:endonuclease/exonuclease/phosphatase family protein [Anaerohalosphaeraceae bacterium]HOL89427.1 endonuclease/exonuclease/phosphatase family protein [Anaerohalosphaeraceae bacterium]HPP55623.1 endonuclease/exonuclease/phosphatase family protein [Anaerohalosphaeraceae bacterium]
MHLSRTVFSLLLTGTLIIQSPAQTPSSSRPLRMSDAGVDRDILHAATFNIRVGRYASGSRDWSLRRAMVISLLAAEQYDVIGLQEALPYQLDEILQGLPQYEAYAVGRNSDPDKGETCAILYKKNRFYRIDSGTIWFSNSPWEPGSKFAGTLFPRICSWVRLADLETARCFYVYNVHLDNLSQRARTRSIEILNDLIASRKHRDPFLVMGDFNMEIDNPAMQILQNAGKNRMLDTWGALYPHRLDEGTYHKFHGSILGSKIDHILVDTRVRVLAAAINRRDFSGRYPSDHYPVSALVQIP